MYKFTSKVRIYSDIPISSDIAIIYINGESENKFKKVADCPESSKDLDWV